MMPLTHALPACRRCCSCLLVLLAGCATPMPRKDDPYENFNRKMYAFNDFADRVAIRPVAVGYRKITNDTTRRLISNFFANIESPITIANDLLQANRERSVQGDQPPRHQHRRSACSASSIRPAR